MAKKVDAGSVIEKVVEEAPVADSATEEKSMVDEKGVLMLRYFAKDDRTGKVLTRLRRKVFFPVDQNIKPGWYITTIVESKDNYGVMDTMELDKVPQQLWANKIIKGIFVERDHRENVLKIYPAIPKVNLEEQVPVCIYVVKLPEPKYAKGATIGEIIQAKMESRV